MMRKPIAVLVPLIAAAVLLVTAGADADKPREADETEIDREIQRLARVVGAAVVNSEVPERDLEKARWHLRRALVILEGRDPGPAASADPSYDYDACVELAYEAYARSHAPKTARRRASEHCKGSRLLDVARLLYRAYSKSYAPPTAMDLALERSENRELHGKNKLLLYAIDRYSKSYAASIAVERAVEEVAKLRLAGFDCLRKANRAYADEHPAFAALDKAFAKCRKP